MCKRSPILAVLSLAILAPMEVLAQPGWTTYPDVVAHDAAAFQAVHAQSQSGVAEILLMDDSQGTCPNGFGQVYVPCLSAYLNGPGNVPRTPWVPAGVAFGGGSPYGAFLVRAAAAAPGVAVSPRATQDNTPAGMRFCTTSAINGANVNGNQWYGWLVCLDHDAAWAHPGTQLQGIEWMDVSEGVYVLVTGRTFPGSSELSFKVSTTIGTPTYYGTYVSTHTTSLGLDAAEGQLLTQAFGPFSVPSGRKLQVEVYGSDPTKFADIATVRFSSVAHPTGYVVSSFSEGGYKADSYLTNHWDTEDWILEMSPAMVWQGYGANDSGQAVTPGTFSGGIKTNTAWVRFAIPSLPVAYVPDDYRDLTGAPGNHQDYLGEYNDVAESYASNPEQQGLMFINSRKMTDALGWSAGGTPGTFLVDGVHYTDRGGRDKAAVCTAAFLAFVSPPIEPPCPADFNGDGFIDFFDYDEFSTAFGLGLPGSDFNGDGFIDLFDYDEFVEAYEVGC